MSHSRRHRSTILALLVAGAACGPDVASTRAAPLVASELSASREGARRGATLDAVRSANAQIAAAAPSLVPPGAPLAPFVEARLYAIASVAMHDALNGVTARYERYADVGVADRHASAAAAVLTAAHDAIVGADHAATLGTDLWYAAAMAPLAHEEGASAGIAIGHRAAAAILARRAGDGTATGGVAPYTPGTTPGDYRFTFPFNTPGFDFFGTGGFADASLWGATVTPFVTASNAQFRAAPPYGAASNAAAVLTAQYTSDFNEIKALGCAACPARSSEQTEIARFWKENSPAGWNRLCAVVVNNRELDAWQAARLLALVAMGEFDAYATSLESKYHYNFWRPVSAVALADADGNPLTTADPAWQVLEFPTPPVPDYPSAHATAGGAGAAIIEAIVPGRGPRIALTSRSLANVTRTFATPMQAAEENALSRVYIGYHFRHAAEVGLAQGRAVGRWVATHALRPLEEGDAEH